MTTTAQHLHEVLDDLAAHVGAATEALPAVTIRGERVVIETILADLAAILDAFGLGAAHHEPCALATGDDYVVVPFAFEGIHNGDRWRVWAPAMLTHSEYAALVAARHPH